MNLYKICFLQDHPKDIFFENYSSIAMLFIFDKMWRNLRGLLLILPFIPQVIPWISSSKDVTSKSQKEIFVLVLFFFCWSIKKLIYWSYILIKRFVVFFAKYCKNVNEYEKLESSLTYTRDKKKSLFLKWYHL